MENLEKNTITQFNKWAKTYDSTYLNYLNFYLTNKKIICLLNPEVGSLLLDVGCGTGILLQQLLKINKNLKLQGLDISEEMLSKAKQKFKNNKDVRLSFGSANKIPFEDSTFNYVTCVQSFHHHPNSLQSLKEMNRVLKIGGKLILLDTALDGVFRTLFSKLEQKLFPEREKDIQRYTKQQMRALFSEAGFKNIKQQNSWYFALITIGEK